MTSAGGTVDAFWTAGHIFRPGPARSEAGMALLQGTQLGPYEVIAPLGSGGMGEVYRARDTRLGREVAIKVLPADKLSDPTRRARFEQEARTVAALNHPHIVTIYEIESAEGIDFIVMELVPGKTLDALIPRHGMRLGEVLRVAIPLADAQAKLSQPGTVAGTPAYMSPEQASGGKVDARSDVFAFGAVLYEMVTGRRPFGGGSTAEMLASLLKEQPHPPSEIVPDVPKELERIILRCLRKEPARRFPLSRPIDLDLRL